MIEARQDTWQADNQAGLVAALEQVHAALAETLESGRPIAEWPGWPALEDVAALFGLDPFARQVLILAAAHELDGRIAPLLGALGGMDQPSGPSAATLFRLSADAHWAALAPQAPLRLLHLVEGDESLGFAERPYRLAERVLHFLLAVPALDTRLAALLRPAVGGAADVAEVAAGADALLPVAERHAVLQIVGSDGATRRALARHRAMQAGRPLYLLAQADLPQTSAEREAFVRLWTREALLSDALLAIDLGATAPEQGRDPVGDLGAFVARLPPGVMVLAPEGLPGHVLDAPRFEMPSPSLGQRRETWRHLLEQRAAEPDLPDRLAAQFRLPLEAMRSSAQAAPLLSSDAAPAAEDDASEGSRAVWAAARAGARPRLANLAHRIEVTRGWDDIVLPPAKMATLRALTAQTAMRSRVYEDWGFGDKLSARGLGITALFAGPSGTGKTLAAEVIAGALDLDLYTIDLSSVVSKYIGETEKNLGRIFDAADAGGVVLLFDEADALFGKRSDVKDSHDRYANIEVGYLLQRMESYSGLAILTTNLKGNMDGAFLRRLRFVVDFPFPDYAERLEIWRRVFPARAPLGDIQPKRLAQLNVSGGAIRNIALNAAFLAAERGDRIAMADLRAAAKAEYAKLEKPLTESEIRGWRVQP